MKQKFPSLAYLGNFMGDNKAKITKISQNALKMSKKWISNGIFSTENCNQTRKLYFLDVTQLVSIFYHNFPQQMCFFGFLWPIKRSKIGKNLKNSPKKGYPAVFAALYLEKMVHDPMFFFIESIMQHPYLIVLEGEKILSED